MAVVKPPCQSRANWARPSAYKAVEGVKLALEHKETYSCNKIYTYQYAYHMLPVLKRVSQWRHGFTVFHPMLPG